MSYACGSHAQQNAWDKLSILADFVLRVSHSKQYYSKLYNRPRNCLLEARHEGRAMRSSQPPSKTYEREP
jgi:hypothetical protein